MNGNQYVDEIVRKYRVARGQGTPVYEAGQRLRGLIQRQYADRLLRVHNSGSFAKGTSIRVGAKAGIKTVIYSLGFSMSER